MTRIEDIAEATALGAAYVGVIFAGGPRTIDAQTAASILGSAGGDARRVGVFGKEATADISLASRTACLDIIQLHGDPSAEQIGKVRDASGREVWAVVHVQQGTLPGSYDDLNEAADAIVLDAGVPGRLGGTGISFDWYATARALERVPRPARLVLAGGLTPANVAEAIGVLHPDVVDVSSGVEVRMGIKDPERMRAFASAVRAAER